MIFKDILDGSIRVMDSSPLSKIFTAIFYENVKFDSYLQLVIVPADNMLPDFRNNTVIVFVEANFTKDAAFINLPILKSKPGIDLQTSNVFPVLQTIQENEDGSETLVTEPLINMMLIDGLSNNINLQLINFELYVRKMDYVNQSNVEDNNGIIIHDLDTSKEYQNVLFSLNDQE